MALNSTYRKTTILSIFIIVILAYPISKYLYRYFVYGIDSGFLKQLGFFSGYGGTLWSWLLALVVGVAYILISMKAIPLIKDKWTEVSWFNGIGILMGVLAAIVEEALFRRFLMDVMARNGSHVLAQILGSGLIFGLAHGWFGLIKGQVRVALSATIATTSLGLALAAVYVIGGRSLAPCIASHALITATIQPWLLLAVMTGKPSAW